MFDAEEDLHQELRVDQIVKKLRTLEGIIRRDLVDDIKWREAYDRYSLFSVKKESADQRRANYSGGRPVVSTQSVNAEAKV